MDHHMLYIRKFLLHLMMHILGNTMRLHKPYITVYRNLQINVNFISELPGMQQIDPYNARLLFNKTPNGIFQFFPTGGIQHLIQRILRNIESYLQYKEADDKTRDRVHDRKADPRQCNTCK